jgi:hypothetical protein
LAASPGYETVVAKVFPRFIFRCLTVALLSCAVGIVAESSAPTASEKQAKKKDSPKPAYSIPLREIGYREPLFERAVTGRFPISLNFFTPDRLLFTFNTKGLLARNVEHCDGPYDDDQLVHAALISLPDGKPIEEARWQLHDHDRYIWPVHGGVLLRRCHVFEFLQDSLTGHRILDFPARPVLLLTSPDGRSIVVETLHEKHSPEEHKRLTEQAMRGDGLIPSEDIDITIISLDSAHVIGRASQRAPVYVPIVREGLYNIMPAQHNRWQIMFQPIPGEPKEVTRVESNCQPALSPLADDVFVVATCVSTLNYHVLIAYDRSGKELWRDEWLNNLSRPAFAFAADNRRFAVATVRTSFANNGFGILDGFSARTEDITVYSTYKGEPLLSISVSPPFATGQNFALSPDGSQLAVLNHGVIEVYNVSDGK